MKTATACAFLSLAVVVAGQLAAPAWAGSQDSEVKFNASDASVDDYLGQAVAISGDIAIVGSDLNDYAGTNAGSAYLLDVTTGKELFKLTASDASVNDYFGHSVAISGNTAIVASFGDDDAGSLTGSAYLYDVTTGNELFKLTASDGATGDSFGHGLAIDGNTVIVGSWGDDDAGANSGSAYVYDVATGNELMKLTASDGASGDHFGYWAAISGNIAIIGAKDDDDAGSRSGSAYLFDVTTGNELMKLTASDAAAGDRFGYAVAIDGNTALVGAWGSNDAGNDSGSVYVFDVATGNELLKLTASDAAAGDYFGYSLGISGDTVVVGSYGDDDVGSYSGSAYLYDLTFGQELGKLTASDAAAGDEFGTAVGISGNTVVVGALGNEDAGPHSGSAYLFDISTRLPPGADFNGDGRVDGADLLIWESAFFVTPLDVNGDDQVDGTDFLLWQRSHTAEIVFDESPANLDQQGPVDSGDFIIWEQSYGVDEMADLDNDGESDGFDFLELQREFTSYDAADVNRDRLVDGRDLKFWETSFGWNTDADGDGDIDGDANGDGIVSELDHLWWLKHTNSNPTMSADFDESRLVDGADLETWADSFAVNDAGDADHDGDSDGRDFLVWQQQFAGAALLAASKVVPEPSSALLLFGLAGIATLVRFRADS